MNYIKIIHILSVFFWFAGMFFLPRVLASQAAGNSDMLKAQAKAIYRKVILPSSMIATTLGLFLAFEVYKFQGGWIHAKIFVVLILWVLQLYLKKIMTGFARGESPKTASWLQGFSWALVVVFVLATFLVIIKPF